MRTPAALLGLALLATLAPAQSLDALRGIINYTGPNATSLWRGYKQPAFPTKGWSFADATLSTTKQGGGGDLISDASFGDLDLEFDFKLGDKANSGVMFRVAETDNPTYYTGPEYQLLEDATYGAKPTDPHACAALYDLVPPAPDKHMNPVGQWNHARIYLRSGLLQHWLNGTKVVETTIANPDGSPSKDWTAKIAASKFKDWKGFGVLPTGHVAIQDHGDTELALRNFTIRDLAAPLPGELHLLQPNSLDHWVGIVPDLQDKPHFSALAAIASVSDGVLTIKGQPIGYLRTAEKYTNYVLRLQWRFDPAKGAGNSGVLLRMVGADKVWPKSVEAQLESGNAGDFWNIDEVKMTTAKDRLKGRNTKHTRAAERPLGEWNEYEIIVNHSEITLFVNGQELNHATDVEEVPGYICLQSEGAQIQIRDIRLLPLP